MIEREISETEREIRESEVAIKRAQRLDAQYGNFMRAPMNREERRRAERMARRQQKRGQ